MDACCRIDARLAREQRRVLWTVLTINALLFLVEFGAGLAARSTALLGDSLDMLGDSLVYGVSLFAVHRGDRWKAGAALTKGAVMGVFGLGVIGQAVLRALLGVPPEASWMGVVGALALAGNVACFALLYRHRSDDVNLRSTWLCSRNDLIANAAVLLAAGAVALGGGLWPDLLVGTGIALLFLRTAATVLGESWRQLRKAPPGDRASHACAGEATRGAAIGFAECVAAVARAPISPVGQPVQRARHAQREARPVGLHRQ